MTSQNSTAPYSEGELQKLLNYVKHLKSVGGKYGFSACIVGGSNIVHLTKLLSRNFSGRLMSFFGTPLLAYDQIPGH